VHRGQRVDKGKHDAPRLSPSEEHKERRPPYFIFDQAKERGSGEPADLERGKERKRRGKGPDARRLKEKKRSLSLLSLPKGIRRSLGLPEERGANRPPSTSRIKEGRREREERYLLLSS